MNTLLCDVVLAESGPVEAAWLAEAHPDLQAVHDYWLEKCDGRAMPARADIDPLDLVPYLPSLMLVDVRPETPHFVYRLVGTREVQVRGVDPTGKPVETHAFGLDVAYALHNYNSVVATRAPWVDRFELLSTDSHIVDGDKLFLPLSEDGSSVNMVLVFTHQADVLRAQAA